MKQKKINKKALIEDFGEFFLTIGILALLTFIVVAVVLIKTSDKQQAVTYQLASSDGSYSTRNILKYEIRPNYHLYNAIIDSVNSNDYLIADKYIQEAIRIYSGGEGEWFYIINKRKKGYNAKRVPFEAMNVLPKVTIPNPQGEDIEVLIKQIQKSDFTISEKNVISHKYMADMPTK